MFRRSKPSGMCIVCSSPYSTVYAHICLPRHTAHIHNRYSIRYIYSIKHTQSISKCSAGGRRTADTGVIVFARNKPTARPCARKMRRKWLGRVGVFRRWFWRLRRLASQTLPIPLTTTSYSLDASSMHSHACAQMRVNCYYVPQRSSRDANARLKWKLFVHASRIIMYITQPLRAATAIDRRSWSNHTHTQNTTRAHSIRLIDCLCAYAICIITPNAIAAHMDDGRVEGSTPLSDEVSRARQTR